LIVHSQCSERVVCANDAKEKEPRKKKTSKRKRAKAKKEKTSFRSKPKTRKTRKRWDLHDS